MQKDSSANQISREELIKIKMAEMICRQTDYTMEDATNKLKSTNYNYISVLNEYYGIKKKPEEELTANQTIYKQIRTMMDEAAYNQRIRDSMHRK